MGSTRFTTRTTVEIALTIALAFILDELRLFQMPQGGSISLGMLPLFVLALLRGPFVGVLAGGLFGVVDVITEMQFIVHPAQFILDYPLPYALVGLAGIMRKTWTSTLGERGSGSAVVQALFPAVVLGASLRYLSHLASGVIFFGEYAPPGQPVVLYSALYNLYVPVSAAACLVAAGIILPVLSRAPGIQSTGE